MILVVNPNSNAATTAQICAIAAPFLPDLQGWTAPRGPSVIQTPGQLAQAADQVALLEPPPGCRGVIVAAFGDPGADRLAARLRAMPDRFDDARQTIAGLPIFNVQLERLESRGGRLFDVVPNRHVRRDRLIRCAAKQFNNWLPFRSTSQIPQRQIDAADCHNGDAFLAERQRRVVHGLP